MHLVENREKIYVAVYRSLKGATFNGCILEHVGLSGLIHCLSPAVVMEPLPCTPPFPFGRHFQLDTSLCLRIIRIISHEKEKSISPFSFYFYSTFPDKQRVAKFNEKKIDTHTHSTPAPFRM